MLCPWAEKALRNIHFFVFDAAQDSHFLCPFPLCGVGGTSSCLSPRECFVLGVVNLFICCLSTSCNLFPGFSLLDILARIPSESVPWLNLWLSRCSSLFDHRLSLVVSLSFLMLFFATTFLGIITEEKNQNLGRKHHGEGIEVFVSEPWEGNKVN